MADVHTTEQRRYNMSRIRSGNTKPEILVRKFLFAQGYRYRLHGGKPAATKALAGKPDIVLPKHRTVIFVHGCFWHGHASCRYYKVPQTRTQWWLDKINRNKANDAKAVKALKNDGWKVITIWKCKLKPAQLQQTLAALLKKLS